MTAAIPVTERSSPPTARAAAVVTWAYAAGFGLSTVPVSITFVVLHRLAGRAWADPVRYDLPRTVRRQ